MTRLEAFYLELLIAALCAGVLSFVNRLDLFGLVVIGLGAFDVYLNRRRKSG